MSFAIRVGTTPGGSDIVNPMANTATGFRALPRIGSVLQTANGWTLTGLAAGTYYWSVQAIDSGLAGSAFAAEESFVAGPLPPTPSIASIGAVRVEGTAIAVSASATDPDSDLTTLSYAWQVFKDGGGTPVATGTGSDWSFTPDDDGSYRIVLTVSDQDDGSGSAEQTISVSNVAPTPSIVSIGSVRVVGTSIAVSGSATEPAGVNDTLSYAWEVYKDGATTPFATGGGTDWSFTPDDSGSYRIALTVSDEDSGSASAEQTIAVSDVAPVIDLEVQGTSADDVIRVLFAKNDTELKVVRNGVVIDRVPVDAITGRIVVQGEDGNDDIRVAPRVTVHADLYGGAGNDTLRGGRGNDRLFGEDGNDVLHGHRGNDIFVGGAGDDRLSGGAGNDILIGGTNSDRLVGGSESDLLVSGSTNFDVDQTALTNMINEWTSASSYADRIGHLTGATGGLNDTTFLSQATVQNDGVQNELRGRSEIDWFAVSSLDKVFVQKKEQALAV